MEDKIFITDFSKIKLNDKLLVLKTPKGEVALDIHFLLNAESDTIGAYFNGTELAKMFDKRFEQLTRNEYWKETVEIVQNLITQNCVIKKPRIKQYLSQKPYPVSL